MKRLKQILSMLLTAALITATLPFEILNVRAETMPLDENEVSIWDGSVATSFAGGSGTENDPYIISTGAQLAYLAKTVNAGNSYKDCYFKLNNDINLNNLTWTPIGGNETLLESDASWRINWELTCPFSGDFNGDGKIISNIRFAASATTNVYGLFGMSSGTIHDLAVDYGTSTIQSSCSYKRVYPFFGGIVAVELDGYLYNCNFWGNITSENVSLSGIVGMGNNITISDCTSSGSLTLATGGTVAGIAGYTGNVTGYTGNSVIVNSKNYADISVEGRGLAYGIGRGDTFSGCVNYAYIECGGSAYGIGIVGESGAITDCSNYGDVFSSSMSCGIVSNSVSDVINVIRCSNYGNIVANGSGGIAAGISARSGIWFQECFNVGNITGGDVAGGIGGIDSSYNSRFVDCYNTGTITVTKPGTNVSGSTYGAGGITSGWHPAYKYSDSISTVINCYNTGEIHTKGGAAAIDGSKYSNGRNCYYLDNGIQGLYPTADFTATALTKSQMQYQSDFVGFDFKNTWAISPDINGGYPYLRNNPPKSYLGHEYITYSKTSTGLSYPVYDEEAFAMQLKAWVEAGEYKSMFMPYLDNGYSYKDLLHLTIDMPAVTQDGDYVSIGSTIEVKDLMAYILFADNAQKYLKLAVSKAESSLSGGNTKAAYSDFLKAIKTFGSQYYYFQESLNGKDTFNQTLYSLLLAKTFLTLTQTVKITYKTGEVKMISYEQGDDGTEQWGKTIATLNQEEIYSTESIKTYAFLNNIYTAQASESPELYDDVIYYIMSGGNSRYLSQDIKSTVDDYSKLIDNLKISAKILKGDMTTSGIIDLSIDKYCEYANSYGQNNKKYLEELNLYKSAYDTSKTAVSMVKAVSNGSVLGLVGATWSLSQKYIDQFKKIYDSASETEAGWYALAYYYLSQKNPDFMKVLLDDSGCVTFDFDDMAVYGIPYDENDIIEKSIAAYAYCGTSIHGGAYLGSTYSPSEAFRFFLWNTCNTAATINQMDCNDYKDMMLQYILADINQKDGISGVKCLIETSVDDRANKSPSSYSFADIGTTQTVTATPIEGAKFVGWKDLTTGKNVCDTLSYTFVLCHNMQLQATFVDEEVAVAKPPVINQQPTDMVCSCGASGRSLSIGVQAVNGEQLQVNWYKNNRKSYEEGVLVGTGSSYTPDFSAPGTLYYYAVVTASVSGNMDTSASIYSNIVKVQVNDKSIVDLTITHLPYRTTVVQGEEFSPSGMTVALNYSDGTSATITDYELKIPDMSTIGEKTVTVSYLGMSKKIVVNVVDEITGKFSDTVFWKIDPYSKILTVYGSGAIPKYQYTQLSAWRSYINDLVIEDGITEIGDRSFCMLYNLETISISGSVTTVGANAFSYCREIKAVTLPPSVKTIGVAVFMMCSNLESICLPDGLSEIPNNLFTGCKNLKSVALPESIMTMGKYAFEGCSLLDNVSLPKNVTTVSTGLFRNCTSLSDMDFANITTIEDNAFAGCTSLTEVFIPETVTSISDLAFDATTLKKIKGIAKTTASDYAEANNIEFVCVHQHTERMTILASCESPGQENALICKNCRDILEQGAYIAPAGHNYGEYQIDILPNTTSVGKISRHCSKCDSTIDETEVSYLKLAGASLTLQDNIQVNYKVAKSLIEQGYTDPYLICRMNGVETKLSSYSVDGDYLVFSFKNIRPDQMNDTITATLHATFCGITFESEAKDYSIATYCYNMLGKCTDDKYAQFRTLLVDLLNYGSASQIYNNYNTSELVSSNLTEEQAACGTQGDISLSSVLNQEFAKVENPEVSWKGAGLNLTNSIKMRFILEAADIENLNVKIQDGQKDWTIQSDTFERIGDTNYYYVYFNGLNAGQLSDSVYVTAYRDEAAISHTLCYSVESYAYSKQNDTNTALSDLVIAMMKYGNSARLYAN